ncbi:hypothetical protein E2562_038020 [Oryza meyeriana var. granulata]|uniref:Uncharacterized protein n=1 Tax=Oryza meyeriana var. granulata TaxID=110450 RepID=A0A6G1ECN1_9ORYZ|nr:hypothetical protein E2562_038020 [Oryza meyeriana var. granulata]
MPDSATCRGVLPPTASIPTLPPHYGYIYLRVSSSSASNSILASDAPCLLLLSFGLAFLATQVILPTTIAALKDLGPRPTKIATPPAMGSLSHRPKLIHLLRAEQAAAEASSSAVSFSPKSFSSSSASDDDGYSTSSWQTTDGGGYASAASSPSRYSASTPPKSPWAHLPGLGGAGAGAGATSTGLIASLVKEDGHVYSLAAAGDVLYTGTESENVRVWRDRSELAGFRTGSGLAIVVADDGRIFTGHQDGKIRVWRADADDPAVHRRVGSLPRLADYIRSSVNPSSYVETRRRGRRREVWLRHSDAVSCLSLDESAGLLYSGSWDRNFKVWRVSDSKCLESVPAHDDAVNTVSAAGFDSVVFTGSADGTVKVWRREDAAANGGEATRHVLETVLRKDESAVTAIAVSAEDRVVYVGSSDGVVTYWHWINGEARYAGALKGHKMAVMCLAVAGNVVVSGSADQTLCVWRRDDAEHSRLAVLTGHTGPVKCVAMDEEESDGERRFVVYSGSLDGSVKVWRLNDNEPTNSPAAEERPVAETPPRPTPHVRIFEVKVKRMVASGDLIGDMIWAVDVE